MRKERFDRLVESLDEVRTHVATGRFAGRISNMVASADDVRAVRMHPAPARTRPAVKPRAAARARSHG
jgi:hypothetical protein